MTRLYATSNEVAGRELLPSSTTNLASLQVDIVVSSCYSDQALNLGSRVKEKAIVKLIIIFIHEHLDGIGPLDWG
jgi:hypothetical protein